MTLKTVVLTANPRASVTTARKANQGDFPNARNPKRRSCQKSAIEAPREASPAWESVSSGVACPAKRVSPYKSKE